MIAFELTEEQSALQERFRRLATDRLRPRSLQIDSASPSGIDREYGRILGEENINKFLIPEAYGGSPLGMSALAVLFEELGSGCAGFAAILAQTFHAVEAVLIGGSERQKKTYLPRLLPPGGRTACFCVTEETGGSNTSSFATYAHPDTGGFLLSGAKSPVINAGAGQFYVVWANSGPNRGRAGIHTFLVPKTATGLSFGPYHDKPGFRTVPTAEVILKDVRVRKSDVIGPAGSGYLLLMQVLDRGRAVSAAIAVGLARTAIEELVGFAKRRVIRERPIIKNQGIGFLLADLVTELEAARMLAWKACRLVDLDRDHTVASSMAKLFASELAVKATTEGTLILGQSGYQRPSLMDKLHRDAQALRIAEGTNHIQRMIISSQL